MGCGPRSEDFSRPAAAKPVLGEEFRSSRAGRIGRRGRRRAAFTLCRASARQAGVGQGELVLVSYLDYYHRSRCHLSLDKDAPYGRPVQPVSSGEIVAFPASRRAPSALRAARDLSQFWPMAAETVQVHHRRRIPGPRVEAGFFAHRRRATRLSWRRDMPRDQKRLRRKGSPHYEPRKLR